MVETQLKQKLSVMAVAPEKTNTPETIKNITDQILTTGLFSREDIETAKQNAKKLIEEKVPDLIQKGIHSVRNFTNSQLGRKLQRGVAAVALLSGVATSGAGYAINLLDKAIPNVILEARNGMVNTFIDAGKATANGVNYLYGLTPAKKVVDDISGDVGQLIDGVRETIPDNIAKPASRIGKRLVSYAHQETAKLIPNSITQGKNAVVPLKRYKESASR